MKWDNPKLAFPNADQYAFLFENAQLLLIGWERDDAKFLFLIKEHSPEGLILDYPGATFTDRVMDTIENIFFVQVEETGNEPARYVLGSYFQVGAERYGAYYGRDSDSTEVVLFRIEGEAPTLELCVLDDDEYNKAAQAFMEQHEDILGIEDINREQ